MRKRSQRTVVRSTSTAQGRTVSAVGNAPVDLDAFDAFEAAGWEEKAVAYERFFGVITGRVVEPLLTAASVGVGTRVLDVAHGAGVGGRPSCRARGISSGRRRRGGDDRACSKRSPGA